MQQNCKFHHFLQFLDFEHKTVTKLHCSFVAVLPIEKPKYVIAVAVDSPKKNHAYGSTVAVPVAKKIIESLIVIEKIPPNNHKANLISVTDKAEERDI